MLPPFPLEVRFLYKKINKFYTLLKSCKTLRSNSTGQKELKKLQQWNIANIEFLEPQNQENFRVTFAYVKIFGAD